MPAPRRITRLIPQYPSLKTLGIAVQYFPSYIHETQFSPHGLDVVLLSFILKGRGRHIMEGSIFKEDGSSLTVTHYGQSHDILTDKKGMEIINVYLDLQNHPLPVLPSEFHGVLPSLLPLHPHFVHTQNRIVRLQFDDPEPLAQLLHAIRIEIENKSTGYEEFVRSLFKLFLIRCCRRALERGFVADTAVHYPLENLRQYLDVTHAEPHTLEALAKRAGLSRTSLCRSFKAYTGKRVFDYLIERRIQSAMIHLRGTEWKVLTIALACGFQDLSYFNRKFKQLVGRTPVQYRHSGLSLPVWAGQK